MYLRRSSYEKDLGFQVDISGQFTVACSIRPVLTEGQYLG